MTPDTARRPAGCSCRTGRFVLAGCFTRRRRCPPLGVARSARARPRARARWHHAAYVLALGVLAAPVQALDNAPIGADAHRIADWVARSHDNGNAPFLIVDKRNARLLVFDADARLQADAPVLLGAARGDDSVPGIGTRKLRDIRPFERTTPAGRFEAEPGRNLQGEDIVWIDYDVAVSMHRVRATNPRERRLQRLATPTIADNRISWGCINVPARFFDTWVSPIFAQGRHAIVYVLPEVHSLAQTFPRYAAQARNAEPPG